MYADDTQMGPRQPGPEDLAVQPEISEPIQRPLYVRRSNLRLIAFRIVALIALIATASAACYFVFGPEAIIWFLEESWPILIAPFAGFALGWYAAKTMYHPYGYYVVCLTPETHSIRVVFVPDQVYKLFNQSGNNVLYHTGMGAPAYIARELDTDEGYIVYSWIHERDALVVMTREEAFINWRQAAEDILRENSQILDIPYIIGLGYTRSALRRVVDGFANVLGMQDRDFSKDTSVESPDDREASNEQSD